MPRKGRKTAPKKVPAPKKTRSTKGTKATKKDPAAQDQPTDTASQSPPPWATQ